MAKKPTTAKQPEALDPDHGGGSVVAAPPETPPPETVIDALPEDLPEAPVEVKALVCPTVGRVVHFYDNMADGPYAAMVTGVSDDFVDLMIFRRAFTMPRLDIPHLTGLESSADGPHWVWPPRG